MSSWRYFALIGLGACSATPQPLDCEQCGEPAPPVRPPPAVVASGLCEQPHTIVLDEADVANESEGEACVLERLDETGCVGERIINAHDANGRIIRTERWVFDPNVARSTYEVPMSTIWTYAYDDAGNRTEEAIDRGMDGTFERRDVISFDERGREVFRVSHALDAPPATMARRYDDEDHVIEQTATNADGTRRTIREYDSQGKLTLERVFQDGEFVFERSAEFDETGRPTFDEKRYAGGRVDRTTHTYDARGQTLRVWHRLQGDRIAIEERHTFDLDESGVARGEIYERRDGGRLVQRRTIQNDAMGRELRLDHDDLADGSIDWFRSASYDAAGNVTSQRTVRGAEVLRDLRHTWDVQGRASSRADHVKGHFEAFSYEGRFRQRVMKDATGRIVITDRAEYDEQDRLRWNAADRNDDGVWDFEARIEYVGNDKVRTRTDNDGDGTWDSDTQWAYDRAGQMIYHSQDYDADGRPERQTLSKFICRDRL